MKLRLVLGAIVLIGVAVYGFALGRAEIFPYEALQRINWSLRDRTQKTGAEITQFDHFPPDVDVVFLGSSATARGNWHDMFPGVSLANRGVRTESAAEIALRLDEIVALTPEKVFVKAGLRDLERLTPTADIVSSFETIVGALTDAGATVYLQSEFECASDPCGKYLDEVRALNDELARLAADDADVVYVDVGEVMSNADGLRAEYTISGDRLTAEGYVAWREVLASFVAG